ncbi:MAG: glutamate 5-kinase, partial [Oscillospiraceae bacterium]|nr:glutamate 5-kinase [Oscillospiraceae bacterium]
VVAVLCGAGKLVLLSDIDGLYDEKPGGTEDARLIREVRVIDSEIRAMAGGSGSGRGTGGMITKLKAAELATANGIDMYIASGKTPDVLYDIAAGRPAGTLFVGKKCKLETHSNLQ